MNGDEFIRQIKSGSQQVLEEIYKEYRNECIAWLINNYKCTKDEARDIYHESIVILYENIIDDKLTAFTSSIKTYLFAVGKNLALKEGKEINKYSDTMDLTTIQQEEQTEDKQILENRIELMQISLSKLGEPCKTLLELYYYHKRNMTEIGKLLNYKNPETTKNLKYKCLKRLRMILLNEQAA